MHRKSTGWPQPRVQLKKRANANKTPSMAGLKKTTRLFPDGDLKSEVQVSVHLLDTHLENETGKDDARILLSLIWEDVRVTKDLRKKKGRGELAFCVVASEPDRADLFFGKGQHQFPLELEKPACTKSQWRAKITGPEVSKRSEKNETTSELLKWAVQDKEEKGREQKGGISRA